MEEEELYISAQVHFTAGQVGGTLATEADTVPSYPRILLSTADSFPYVTLFPRDRAALERLREVCTELLDQLPDPTERS